MVLSVKQIEITQEFRTRLHEEIKEYATAPKDITGPLDVLWTVFKQTAEFDDDNQADLAGFGALAQFAMLADKLEDKDLRGLLALFSTSILLKVRKGDRLD